MKNLVNIHTNPFLFRGTFQSDGSLSEIKCISKYTHLHTIASWNKNWSYLTEMGLYNDDFKLFE